MTQDFYKERIKAKGIDVVIPNEIDIELVNHVIYNELCVGNINEASRRQYIRIIEGLREKGAEAVILGCTEIGLLIQQSDTALSVYDTTQIHAKAITLNAIKELCLV